MHVFYYDRSFDGLLSAVFDAYTLKRFPDALLDASSPPPLLTSSTHAVATAPEKWSRVFRGLEKRLTLEGRRTLLLAWLAEEDGWDMRLFQYIRKVFDAPRNPENDLADPLVFAIARLAKKVSGERHQFLGFTRFQKTADGIYFAAISPRHNVLTLMLRHFADRFADQKWVLYDVGRHYGVMFDSGRFAEVFLDEATVRSLVASGGKLDHKDLAAGEKLLQDMWRQYFDATAIRERVNPRLQSRCMPRRFWKFLTEKQETTGRSGWTGAG